MTPSRLSLAALSALGLASCSPDTEALEVAPSISEVIFSVEKSAFGSADDPQGTPKGQFTLSLKLGPNASGPTEVTVQSFAIVDTNQQLLLPLPVQSSAQKVFSMKVNSTQQFIYTLNYDKPQKIGPLCAAKQVLISGTILDSARGKTTPFFSNLVPVACP